MSHLWALAPGRELSDEGLERSAHSPNETTKAQTSAANSHALGEVSSDPDLVAVIAAWPSLSAEQRSAIVAYLTSETLKKRIVLG